MPTPSWYTGWVWGARPGELEFAAGDPKAWARSQLQSTDLPGGRSSLELMRSLQKVRRGGPDEVTRWIRQVYRSESIDRYLERATTGQPFRLRWANFWSNHFTASANIRTVRPLAVAYEREAIRPNCTGSFLDLLRAVAHHPAMLFYLDNQASVGPNSRAGRRREKGLNENYARELLELHTLGVEGGYTQGDVTELARILTGWGVARDPANANEAFAFTEEGHEPGKKTLLGVTYAQGGKAEGDAALAALAEHPATARNVSARLLAHFVGELDPRQENGARANLERVFRETNGSLRAMGEAILEIEALWDPEMRRLRNPEDWLTAGARAIGPGRKGGSKGALGKFLFTASGRLGQAPLSPLSPKGWSDADSAWSGPESMVQRVELAIELAGIAAEGPGYPEQVSEAVLGPMLRGETRRAIEGESERAAGFALFLASPEMMRR